MKEIETKIIDIDENDVRKGLERIGAKFLGSFFLRRYIFFMSRAKGVDEFIRVRTDGNKSTLTYKFRKGKGLANTEEIEVEVSDFENTAQIISKLYHNFVDKPFFQESRLEKWDYNGTEVVICEWPLVPKFIEIEAKSERNINMTIKKLRIKGLNIGNTNLGVVFDHYGKHGLDVGDLRFDKR